MTAEEINKGMLEVWRANKVQLLVQVHDSILFQFPEELEDEIVPWALNTLRIPLDLAGGRNFVVPTEAKVGWNWGDFAKDNPDGLVKWKGGDDRKRSDLNWTFSFRGL
jgi:DNA polymerase I-like protein with 3'-5' exonuclease and polymerase domains